MFMWGQPPRLSSKRSERAFESNFRPHLTRH